VNNVIRFSLKQRAKRSQAMNWLAQSGIAFPLLTEAMPISSDVFCGWRFVLGSDGVVYFANCVDQGVTEVELRNHKEVAA